MFNQYFCVINQFFCMMNQKMVHHTENFWGSGFYRETVRPNCFLCTNALTTNLTFCLEFSPILMSNMNWHLILWYPGWRQFLFILFPHLKCWPHVFHRCANCIPPAREYCHSVCQLQSLVPLILKYEFQTNAFAASTYI